MNRQSLKDLYAGPKSARELRGDFFVYALYRPISFAVTPAFLTIGATATNVTVLNLILASLMPLLALLAPDQAYIGLALITFACIVLDCVDGNIARATNSASALGQYLDSLVGKAYYLLLVIALAIVAHGEVPRGPRLLACRGAGRLGAEDLGPGGARLLQAEFLPRRGTLRDRPDRLAEHPVLGGQAGAVRPAGARLDRDDQPSAGRPAPVEPRDLLAHATAPAEATFSQQRAADWPGGPALMAQRRSQCGTGALWQRTEPMMRDAAEWLPCAWPG